MGNNVFEMTPKNTTLLVWYLSQRLSHLEKNYNSNHKSEYFDFKQIENLVKVVLKALSFKDENTFEHSVRTAEYSLIIGKQLKLSEKELMELEFSAIFHDIGKIAIPDNILNKPSRLNEDEFMKMKEHPVKSYELIKEIDGFENVALGARGHHERFDGNGYPDKLKGEDIPLYSRIILISDTYDSMTEDRVYRKGLSQEIAFEELDEFSGSQFDEKLVKEFKSALNSQAKNNDKSLIFLKDTLKKVA